MTLEVVVLEKTLLQLLRNQLVIMQAIHDQLAPEPGITLQIEATGRLLDRLVSLPRVKDNTED